MCSEDTFRKTTDMESTGTILNGEIISTIRYTDDTVALGESGQEL